MSKYESWSKDNLIKRIQELEISQKVSDIDLSKLGPSSVDSNDKLTTKKKKQFDFKSYSQRKIVLRFAYNGWDYHGLAYQKEGHKTVEGEIIKALYKTKCIETLDPADCMFSRCGRTDADVSALAQVISLNVRSVVPAEFHSNSDYDKKELDYIRILNSNLPPTIVFYAVCLNPDPDFDARFSCLSRTYRYFFDKSLRNLNLDLMQEAADKFLGEHDFRNFCKIDGSKQLNNFKRTILKSKIVDTGKICYFELQGTAFLWNQVRSMMAILFLVGQKLENTDIVSKLLDVKTNPKRPVYEIAWGVPLELYDCEFPEMEWIIPYKVDVQRLEQQRSQDYMKVNMVDTLLEIVNNKTGQELYPTAIPSNYVPLKSRQLCDEPEAVNARWLARKEKKVALANALDS